MSKHNNLHHSTTQHGAGTGWIYSGYEKYSHALKISTISYREACCQDKKKTLFSPHQSCSQVGSPSDVFWIFQVSFSPVGQSWCRAATVVLGLKLSPSPFSGLMFLKSPSCPNFFRMIMEVTELFPSLVQMGVLPQDCVWAHEEVLWISFLSLICTTSWYLDKCVPWKSGPKPFNSPQMESDDVGPSERKRTKETGAPEWATTVTAERLNTCRFQLFFFNNLQKTLKIRVWDVVMRWV